MQMSWWTREDQSRLDEHKRKNVETHTVHKLDKILSLVSAQAATQFKLSLAKLMEILMSKEPSYVRCIKPNDAKQPGKTIYSICRPINHTHQWLCLYFPVFILLSLYVLFSILCLLSPVSSGRFDEVLVRHQVKYLGLMENLRVRRAGFAYRRNYEAFLERSVSQKQTLRFSYNQMDRFLYFVLYCFLHRYKSLCPDTWPNWHGKLPEGVDTLVKHLNYKPEEYKLGRWEKFSYQCWKQLH